MPDYRVTITECETDTILAIYEPIDSFGIHSIRNLANACVRSAMAGDYYDRSEKERAKMDREEQTQRRRDE